jgi:hypothetical protein
MAEGGRKYGRPAICPKCPPKHYYGALIGPHLPAASVKVRKSDVCPNCETPLSERR